MDAIFGGLEDDNELQRVFQERNQLFLFKNRSCLSLSYLSFPHFLLILFPFYYFDSFCALHLIFFFLYCFASWAPATHQTIFNCVIL